jgi:outer membrane protein assembly factor BamB
MRYRCFVVGVASVLIFSGEVSGTAQEWTRFRGPNGTGISAATTIPDRWGEQDINWKIELPGVGQSSPVLWGGKLFLTSADGKEPKLYLFCIETNQGHKLWQKELELVPYPLHQFNTFASATPAVDARQVYLPWLTLGHYHLTAFDHEGKTVWDRDLGAFESQHGSGASPIVYGDRVILMKDPDGESFVVAVDVRDGHTCWQIPLHGARADYSTPCVAETLGSKPLLLFTSMEDGVLALDAYRGTVAWQLEKVFGQRCVSSPVVVGAHVIGSCGSGAGGNYVAAVRVQGEGRDANPELAYTIRKSAPYVPTSLAFGDSLFLWSDAGIVTCVDSTTGTVLWQERVGGSFFASPVCVDGRLFNVSLSGEVVVLKAAKEFKELARNSVGEGTSASLAVSGGRMYIRTFKHLMSVGGNR